MDELIIEFAPQSSFHYGKFNVTGMYYASDRANLKKTLYIGKALYLQREKNNKYDSNAVAVYDDRYQKIGYISKNENEEIASLMDDGITFDSKIIMFREKRTGASIVIEVKCTSPKELFQGALDKWKRKTLIEEINKT